jgi:hypothetical protein
MNSEEKRISLWQFPFKLEFYPQKLCKVNEIDRENNQMLAGLKPQGGVASRVIGCNSGALKR